MFKRDLILWLFCSVVVTTVFYLSSLWRNCPTSFIIIITSSSSAGMTNSTVEWSDFPAHAKYRLARHGTSLLSSNSDPVCHAGALCAGPGRAYSGIGRQVGTKIRGEFVVPPLPESFSTMNQTYYDYINIFWRQNVYPGYMNQFVPQLMLGSALANSSNHPDYEPMWLELTSWHIGAQYFMAICNHHHDDDDDDDKNNSIVGKDCDNWTPKAATGELIAVEPGEGVFTTFELVDPHGDGGDVEWHLTMGVMGDASRVSHLVVPTPFMGLVSGTTSWLEDIYDSVYVGSCLENYGMDSPSNYPSFWWIDIDIQTSEDASEQPMWQDWRMDHDKDCDWQPKSAITSSTSNHQGTQTASWKAWLEKGQRKGQIEDTITSI
jgi:hypothetical protein